MEVTTCIHNVKSARVSSHDRSNSNSVTLHVKSRNNHLFAVTFFGSAHLRETLVAAFGDIDTIDFASTGAEGET